MSHFLHELLAMFRFLELINALVIRSNKKFEHFKRGWQVIRQRHLMLEDSSLLNKFDSSVVTVLIKHDFFEQPGLLLVILARTRGMSGLLFQQNSKYIL